MVGLSFFWVGLPKSRKGRCFTLVELLVVMAIITILASMLLPSLSTAREKARRASCMSNLKQLGIAIRMYSGDNGEKFPSAPSGTGTTLASYGLLTNQYQTAYKLWLCPSDSTSQTAGSPTTPFTSNKLSYAYNGFCLSETVQPDTPIAADRSNAFGGGGGIRGITPYSGTVQDNSWTHKADGANVLFADGHVQFQRVFVPTMYYGENP